MRRYILGLAAILITFAIGVGADRVWWHFMAAPPLPTKVETAPDVPPQLEVVFVPAPALPPPPPPAPKANIILDYDSNEDGIMAAFYIMGSKTKAFADIEGLHLMLYSGSEDAGDISVVTQVGEQWDSAPATFGLVTERRIFFVTSKLEKSDFEYRFDGEFLRKDFQIVEGKNKGVLRGTLTKTKNGRTIAQQEFTFRMEYVGC